MRIFTFLFLLVSFSANAQPCAGPGRIPETAFAICGSLTFSQPNVPTCTAPDLPPAGCGGFAVTSASSVWYKFHCFQGGTLGFLITPASLADDYDWALMDVTGQPPQNVLITNLQISLNISGITGTTGCTAAGTLDVNCAGNFSPYNRMPVLVTGNDYLLMVTNWSNSGLGYNLDFNGGTAVLTNNLPPAITSVTMTGCNSAQLNVNFSEDILCSSLTATGIGSEFTISNGTNVISSINSICSTGTNTFTSITINLQNPLPPGNYQLNVNNGTDNNTLLDICQEPIPVGTSFPFTIPAQVPLAVSNISFTGCAPTVFKVSLSKPVLCSSISAVSAGSELSITPGNHVIASISSACSSGALYTDTLLITLQNQLPHGNYQLNINNGGLDGNTFIDTCGTAFIPGYQFPLVIAQTIPPSIQTVTFDECKPFRIVLDLDKPIACDSLAVNGSEFLITPGSLTVNTVTSNCIANGFTSQLILDLSGNLPAGNFNVQIKNGTDGNTICDSCFSFTPINTIKSFTTTQAPLPIYDSVQYDRCTPSEIKVFYSKPINCNSVFMPGTEFYITGPATVNIASVSGDPATCSTSFSNWLILHLAQPITTFGAYTLHNRWGSDGNSVMDTCYAKQDTTDRISFNVLGKPSATFTDIIHRGCEKDTIILSQPGGNGINSWTWNFSDGTNASGQNVSHTFPISIASATVQLIVANGFCSDTLLRTYPIDHAIDAAFSTSADTTCRNLPINITNNSTGTNLQWLWDYGDNTQNTNQNAASHAYSSNDSFLITLIITNNFGCKDTATKKLYVTAIPIVDFTGLNTQYCTGETLNLVSNMQGNINNYSWNNGNGSNFRDQPTISYSYNVQGDYTVTLSATDRFCGVITKDSITKVFRVPYFDLGPDKTLCPGITVQIGTSNQTGYNYLWNTNATTAMITTGLLSNTYKLSINNNGCLATDEIVVHVLGNCLIRVPGAFTPNGDGLNDRLKAINADLATNFSLKVYNRFGQLLFATVNPLEGWDGNFKGNPAETGTYIWQLSYIDPVTKLPVYEKGSTILIR